MVSRCPAVLRAGDGYVGAGRTTAPSWQARAGLSVAISRRISGGAPPPGWRQRAAEEGVPGGEGGGEAGQGRPCHDVVTSGFAIA
jgi:hypothetical protein